MSARNLGPQFAAFTPLEPTAQDGGSYPVYSKGPDMGANNKRGAEIRMGRAKTSFEPKNEDGMTVIARDARSDGKSAAWQNRGDMS